jgi:hypothetical protein
MANFQPPPAGLHRAVISSVENDLLTKSGNYRMCKVNYSLLSMGCAGARVSCWYILSSAGPGAKPFAVQQGRKNLSQVFEAAGKPAGHPSTLSGSRVTVIVAHKPNDKGDAWPVIDSVMPDSEKDAPASVNPNPATMPDGMPF